MIRTMNNKDQRCFCFSVLNSSSLVSKVNKYIQGSDVQREFWCQIMGNLEGIWGTNEDN